MNAESIDSGVQSLQSLIDNVSRFAGVGEIFNDLVDAQATTIQMDGLTGAAKSLFLAWLFRNNPNKYLIITANNDQVTTWWDDLHQFGLTDEELYILPATAGLRMGGDLADKRSIGERIAALEALQSDRPAVIIATGISTFQSTLSPNQVFFGDLTIETGRSMDILWLTERLSEMGYSSETTVSGPGQFSRRGGIVDIFPITADVPARLDFFGDEIESIRTFDIASQRSQDHIKLLRILPANELRFDDDMREIGCGRILESLRERKMELAREKNREAFDRVAERVEKDVERIRTGSAFDGISEYLHYLTDESLDALSFLSEGARKSKTSGVVILDEPGQILIHDERLVSEVGEAQTRRYEHGDRLDSAVTVAASLTALPNCVSKFKSVTFSQLARNYAYVQPTRQISASGVVLEAYRSQLPKFVEEVKRWTSQGAEAYIVSDQPHRVGEICRELGLLLIGPNEETVTGSVRIVEGRLRRGFKFVEAGLLVATDAELFGGNRPVQNRKRATGGVPISTVLDLKEGDFVVHLHHGIGLYKGLVKRHIENADRDFLHVQYSGGDSLYVPADQIDRVQRYVGDGAKPLVHRIGGGEWSRITKRVKEQAKDIANELIELYAARHSVERPGAGPDTNWQMEMEEAFPYEETPGQMQAIMDVKTDLEQDRPMDRLVCADVGFGKTEVAIRAAFKAVDSGRQVAVLCPTTILAAQHFNTFSQRLAAYPTNVALLSRFRTKAEQKETVEALRIGAVDIVIGTHRLLSKDVEFKNLGLIVVDEEQRFGVSHKERLKQMRKSVDVLTLTATPIPRTLSMAMSGLRDMSVIEDPPKGRMPIITYVREYDDDLVKDAMPHKSVAVHLQKVRFLGSPHMFQSPCSGFLHSKVVHAIHQFTCNSMRSCLQNKIGLTSGPGYGSAHSILVILQYIKHRQLEEAHHVKRFMDATLVHCTIAEIAHADILGPLILQGKSHSQRDGNWSANNSVASQKSIVWINKVHGTALAECAACRAPHQFGHNRLRIRTASKGVRMVTIGAEDFVAGQLKLWDNPCYECFLTIIPMQVTTHFAFAKFSIC